jgi:hypothetical protein
VLLASASPAGVFGVAGELPPEGAGVLGAQLDLVIGAAGPEPDRLIRQAALEIVFKDDGGSSSP